MKSFSGTVAGAELCSSLEGVEIVVKNIEGNEKIKVFSNHEGRWELEGINEEDKIIFSKKGYVQKEMEGGNLPVKVRLLEDCLIGYHDKLWFLPGEKVTAYIHAPVSYRATLFRHGLEKEEILSFKDRQAITQAVPDGNFVDTGVNWLPSFSYEVPEKSEPGLYSLMLSAQNYQSFSIPMVVSTPMEKIGSNKFLVLMSTNNWQSYNLWGGRSRYRNFEDGDNQQYIGSRQFIPKKIKKLIKKITPRRILSLYERWGIKSENKNASQWKFQRLSIKRPFTNCYLGEKTPFVPFTNHLASGEWRLLAWLERENIGYDVISGYEFHHNPYVLEFYKAIVLSTHCEYWSREMFRQLTYCHKEKGVWIINLSGNSIYREIGFYDDGSSRCVSLSFAESCSDETQLIGVRFKGGDYGTCAPYKVIKRDHWVFQNLPLHPKNQFFGTMSLNQNTKKKTLYYDPGRPGLEYGLEGMGASGWETDKLSTTAPKDFEVVARGVNIGGGADMVVRNAAGKRGGVFSASSICFSGSLLIDEIASGIVLNVVRKIFEDG